MGLLSDMLSDMSFDDDEDASAILANARAQANQLGRTLAHIGQFDVSLANAIARAFPAPPTPTPPVVEPRLRLVNLQSLVTLSPERPEDIARFKREHDERNRSIGALAYNKIRTAHALMDGGLYQADQRANRLQAFTVRKNEIMNEVRASSNNSRSDYISAMVEYNRLLAEFPLFVRVPEQAAAIPAPRQVASARQVQVHLVEDDDDDDDYIPISGLRTNRVQTQVQDQAPARVVLPPRSSAPGKSHLRMLCIKVCVDSTLDIKEAKKKRGGGASAAEVVVLEAAAPESECQICTLAFSTKMAPKVRLNCGHETCANCIVTMAQGRTKHELCCPFCRDGIVGCEIGTNFAMAKLNKALSKT
jgi:hypothetical protein